MTIDLASDFRDLLQSFVDHEVRFLVVGSYALAVHARPRATGDLDVWIDATRENAERVYAALAFGAPLHDLTREDLERPGTVFQIGVPPLRIDILTSATGIDFATAWSARVESEFEGVRFPVIGRRDLLANKRALGRTQDLADLERLEREDRSPRTGGGRAARSGYGTWSHGGVEVDPPSVRGRPDRAPHPIC